MPPVGSQEIMCKRLVLVRVFATSWFSVESVRTIGSQVRVWDQLVLN